MIESIISFFRPRSGHSNPAERSELNSTTQKVKQTAQTALTRVSADSDTSWGMWLLESFAWGDRMTPEEMEYNLSMGFRGLASVIPSFFG